MKTPQIIFATVGAAGAAGMSPLGLRNAAEVTHNLEKFAHDCRHDFADLAQRKANAPLKPKQEQLACDHGLFSDEAAQIDLIEMLQDPVED